MRGTSNNLEQYMNNVYSFGILMKILYRLLCYVVVSVSSVCNQFPYQSFCTNKRVLNILVMINHWKKEVTKLRSFVKFVLIIICGYNK